MTKIQRGGPSSLPPFPPEAKISFQKGLVTKILPLWKKIGN